MIAEVGLVGIYFGSGFLDVPLSYNGIFISTFSIMSKTLVIQSHRTPLPMPWLAKCIDSVKEWAEYHSFDYSFLGDELFDCLSPEILKKTAEQKVIATDLARLKKMQFFLAQGYQTVVWCDADFLVFDVASLVLPDDTFGVGREVWIQPKSDDQPNRYKAHVKVHNAFMFFRQGNSFLDFYTDSAERLLQQTKGPMPPQFIGPKLLTALHNVVQCPVVENAGMLSPAVIKDILAGKGRALDLFKGKSIEPLAAANLCSSMTACGELADHEMELLIKKIGEDSDCLN
jgi:hypothetical protein